MTASFSPSVDARPVVAIASLLALAAFAGCSSEVLFSTGTGGEGGDAGAGGNTSVSSSVSSSSTGGSGGIGGSGGSGGSGAAQPVCGDGIIAGGESCDGANLGGANCQSLGFAGGVLSCSATCSFTTSSCFSCGDNIKNGMEACDGGDLGGANCQSLGFDGGTLGCTAGCTFNTANCTVMGENCNNGIDDDNDGLIDCADPNCQNSPFCGPIEAIVGCDPALCTFAAGAGPNGGDLCTCTVLPGRHPVADDLVGNLCSAFNNGVELTLQFNTMGYDEFTVSTCEANTGDSSLAAFDGNPAQMSALIACNGDAGGEANFCSELTNSQNSGPPVPTALPANGQLWIQLDEWQPALYWNNTVARVVQIELISTAPATEMNCTDGIDNDNDMNTDCADSDCAAHPSCMQPVEAIVGCNPSHCTFTPASGPNGGDMCSCVLPGPKHPQQNSFQIAGSCAFFGGGRDLAMLFNTSGYSAYSVTTCATPGDSSILVLNNVPGNGEMEIACSGDAAGESMFCSEVGDSGAAGPPVPLSTPATNKLFITIEEFNPGIFWNGMTTRQIDVELIP